MKKQPVPTSFALKIAIPYFIISIAWILFSDKFVASMSPDVEVLTTLQTYKGWFFITLSSIFVYLTSRHYLNRIARSQQTISAKDTALVENQQGMFSLLASLPGMAYRCTFDGDRRMVFVTENCRTVCNRDSNELIGSQAESWGRLIIEEDREMVTREIRQAVRDRTTFNLEYRIDIGRGRTKWVSDQGCAIHSAASEQYELVGYVFEVSDSRRSRPIGDGSIDGKPSELGSADRSVVQGSNLIGRPM